MGGILILLAIFLLFGISNTVKAAVAPFGGRLLFFSPPFFTGFVNCPPLAAVLNYGGPYKGLVYLTLPPIQPKLNYNFYTPGVAVLGNFTPIPEPFNCPFQPIFPSNIFGTSAQ